MPTPVATSPATTRCQPLRVARKISTRSAASRCLISVRKASFSALRRFSPCSRASRRRCTRSSRWTSQSRSLIVPRLTRWRRVSVVRLAPTPPVADTPASRRQAGRGRRRSQAHNRSRCSPPARRHPTARPRIVAGAAAIQSAARCSWSPIAARPRRPSVTPRKLQAGPDGPERPAHPDRGQAQQQDARPTEKPGPLKDLLTAALPLPARH